MGGNFTMKDSPDQIDEFYDSISGRRSTEPEDFGTRLLKERFTVTFKGSKVKLYLKDGKSAPDYAGEYGFAVQDITSLSDDDTFDTVVEYMSLSHYMARETVKYNNNRE
jgi:hypothetical protein